MRCASIEDRKETDTMPTAADKVVDEALELPAEARIGLVDRILASLNLPTRPEIDRLWAEEAERRVAEIDRGDVALVPGEDVFAKIRRKYAR
jgi:putative addiction module component (TIGR02574 family)